MTITEFDQKYNSKGGFKLLNEFKEERMTLKYISDHFGVSRFAVQEWMLELYGTSYDPRQERKEKILQSMLDFAKKHTLEEFKDAYYYISKHYYNKALTECYVQGIFKEDDSEVPLPRTGKKQEANPETLQRSRDIRGAGVSESEDKDS